MALQGMVPAFWGDHGTWGAPWGRAELGPEGAGGLGNEKPAEPASSITSPALTALISIFISTTKLRSQLHIQQLDYSYLD